jgi:CheY-like chemotaxis protein
MSCTGDNPILIVEDSHEDFIIIQRALTKAGVTNNIFRCTDAFDALDYLNRRGHYADAAVSPRPAIVLLDLNLPGMTGRELLQHIKVEARLSDIPAIVLTTSGDAGDMRACYALGAAGYIQKPIQPGRLVDAFKNLAAYWFETVSLPQ